MASYPNTAITFTTRSNGQTIDASHVNSLQDEVAAIESGLLGGTAPIVSSHVTGTGLQISGNSTITGTLLVQSSVVLGNLELASFLLVNGAETFNSPVTMALGSTGAVRWESTNGGPVQRLNNRLTSTPAAPASTGAAVIYLGDNGAGKTQLVVRFPSGAAQIIATEP